MQLPKYDSYKNSGVEWLGEIPEEWNLWQGFQIFQENKAKNSGMVENTVLSLSYGRIIVKPEEKLHGLVPESFEGYQLIEPDDTIIRTTDLQNDHTSLRCGYAKDKGIITSAYLSLKPLGTANPKFTYYVLHAYDLLKVFYGMGSGLRQNLDFRDFKRMIIPIPESDVQERIVSFLDQKTAEIDEAIAKKQKLIELLQEQKSILINQAVTKGLNPDAPMKDSGVEWIGEIPAHWEVKKAGYVARLIQTGPFGSQLHQDEYITGGIPIINPSHMADGLVVEDKRFSVSAKTADRLSRHRFKIGDIAIARRGEMGRCALINDNNAGWLCGTGSMLFRPKRDSVDPSFFSIVFRSHCVVKQLEFSSVGATMDNLNTDLIAKTMIPVPEKTEQVDILKYSITVAENSLQLQHTVEKEIATLQEFKQSLISSAVTGKIKV